MSDPRYHPQPWARAVELAQQYGVSNEDVGAYLGLTGSLEMTEAACAARARGVPHQAVRAALYDGATKAQLEAMRGLNERATGDDA